MSADCGVLRNKASLTSLLNWVTSQSVTGPAPSALLAARLIVMAALSREESRGGHFREDFTTTEPHARRSYLSRDSSNDIRIELRPIPDSGAQA